MATQTHASDHASITDEQYVKNEKDEAIAEKIASLANDDEDKHDKPEDAQSQATPSSKTEEDEVKPELAAVEAKKSDDSPALEVSAEDSAKHDKVEDAQSPTIPTEVDDQKVEPAVAVENTEDSVPLDPSITVADNLKEEKELVPDSQTISVTEPEHDEVKCQPDEPLSSETPQQLEKEPLETDEEKQPKATDIPEALDETIEKLSNIAEANPVTESEADVVKEAEVLETSAQEEEKPEPVSVATQVQEKTEEPEPEKEFLEAEQPSTIAVPEPSAEANEKPRDTIEEKTIEPSTDVSEETNNNEAGPTETVEAEPEVTEVQENQKEPEKQSLVQREEEQPDSSAIPEHSAETSDAIEEKTREPEIEAEVLKETNNYKAGPTETEIAEPAVTKADESQSEPEKQSLKEEEEEQPKTVVIPETEAEIAKQTGDIVEDHPPKDSDIEVVKESGNSESAAVPTNEEKPEPVSTEVDEKPSELLQLCEDVGKTSNDVDTEQETVLDTAKNEETSDDTIKDSILSFKEEKSNKEEESSLTENAAQVSSNGEAQAAPTNLVEPSSEGVEKVVEVDGKKESSFTDVIEGVSNEAGVVIKEEEVVEEPSIDQEAKTGLKEEREYYVPEEKVAVAANDDKKEPEAADAAPESSREAEVESKIVEEQNGAKTATTEAAESVKVESVKDDSSTVDDKKEGNGNTKVDEISTAVSEPIRETLASKFEEKEEESTETGAVNSQKELVEAEKTEVQATKESDATKTARDLPKETPAKPAQKQSNNIISKVKQSLVKAKKAITGKSPSSKNLSSEAKGDIKVK
ncbi:enolase-phosphatase E1-like isoform X2 [Abrus precatorius]|uniref:Enolase-phosphatase E1-like isoform X2 n=1 Tax=Abrus precatorius TaxID=3816 RepID=A0A8B8M6H1_ABRPR|nr:enolase-phosphatase E1-like isoform X2 [Abrus precatorius]